MIPLFFRYVFRRRPQRQDFQIKGVLGEEQKSKMRYENNPADWLRGPGPVIFARRPLPRHTALLRRRIAVDFPRNQRAAYPCTQRTAGAYGP